MSDADLKSQLKADLTTAMKARDQLRAATIRMVLTAVTTAEVSGKQAKVLSDAEVLAVLTKEAKKRRESEAAYREAGRPELADQENAEFAIIDSYLPAQLTAAELTDLVAEGVAETGATGPQSMGAVMKVVQPKVAGRCDGGLVAAEVKRQLAEIG